MDASNSLTVASRCIVKLLESLDPALLPMPLLRVLPRKGLPTNLAHDHPGTDMNFAEMFTHAACTHWGGTLPTVRLRPCALYWRGGGIDAVAIAQVPLDHRGRLVHRELHVTSFSEATTYRAVAPVGRRTIGGRQRGRET